MSDNDLIIDTIEPIDGNSVPDRCSKDRIVETITVNLSADITASQHAKILRQVSNILHALMANAMRYAAIGDGRNAGAGFQVHQQTFSAAANVDSACRTLEEGQRAQVLTGPMPLPSPPGSRGFGRA